MSAPKGKGQKAIFSDEGTTGKGASVPVDPSEFLQAVFSIAPPGGSLAWVTIFDGDPKNDPDHWTGFAHDPQIPLPSINGSNAYFSIAAFHPDANARQLAEQHAVLALVLDDVGTKAKADHCRRVLGEPSYSVETSLTNYQWGYLPEKAIRSSDMEPLHDALKKLNACDPSGVNSIRYVRLPGGINGKPDANRFRVRLVEWHPERRYPLAYFQDRLKVDPAAPKTKERYKSPDEINDGERDDSLASFAGLLYAAKGITDGEVLEMLRDRNQSRCKPPLADTEVIKIAKSMKRTHERKQTAKVAEADDQLDEESEFASCDPGIVEELKHLHAKDFILPNDYVSIPWAAERVFRQLAREGELFLRGRELVEVVGKREKELVLVTPDGFRSRIVRRHRLRAAYAPNRGPLALKSKECNKDTATKLLESPAMQEYMPTISLVTKSPVLAEIDGELLTLGPGYHAEEGGVMVLAKGAPEVVSLAEATKPLLDLLADFHFAEDSDKSRAVAGLIAPAIRMGRLLGPYASATVDVVEANQSQAGKGFLKTMGRAIYGDQGQPLARTEGGVGGPFDEKLGHAIFQASPFVCADNLRGRFASEFFESIITSPTQEVAVRLPYKASVKVDVSRMTFQVTSNGYETTVDMGNRSLITRLLKQADDYQYRKYDEGSVREHIETRQSYYLGCVFAVVREWHARGKQQLAVKHDGFKEWLGTLDFIVQEIFGLPPLLKGHKEAVERVASVGLSWLRLVAHQVIKERREGKALQASMLVAISKNMVPPAVIPGTSERSSDEALAMRVGSLLMDCFKTSSHVVIDNTIKITRTENTEYVPTTRDEREVRRYVFEQVTREGTTVADVNTVKAEQQNQW